MFSRPSDDIGERYDNLSKSVSDRNEKLQITLTRSMSVQDGLDDMMGWIQGVEVSVTQTGHTPLDSAALGALLSKEAVRTYIHTEQGAHSMVGLLSNAVVELGVD